MKKLIVIGLVVAVLAAVVARGHWWHQSRQDNGLTLYGNVDIRTVNLSFRVGECVESLAAGGDDVIKAGQVLGELDRKPYEVALMQAGVGVSAAQAQYDLMFVGHRDEEIVQTAAVVKQAQAVYDYVQNFYNRQQGLWKSHAISVSDLGNAHSSRDQAWAILKSAQDKLHQHHSDNRKQDIAQTRASLEQAQAQLTRAELNLQDSMLIALLDGTLLTRTMEPDTVPDEGGTVFTVSLTCSVQVHAYVDKRNLDQTQPRRKVLFYIDGCPDKSYHEQIGLVSPIARFTPKTIETPGLCTDLVYCPRIVMTDVGDVLRQGVPVVARFGNETGHG